MNIKEAKQEISNTLKVYHEKDEQGNYRYDPVRQRPILLMGPPGIGKTAIMEQVAKENGVGLVAYTITHHTRQSAIGLPRICDRSYGEEHFPVTEYTMSEIIASVYDCMEKTGKKEGILFIDEINCASETLAPTMLQFLQNKTFGSHRVPEGWMITAAGNPPEYNKSVREFDIVTLDRVRKIDIDVDCDIWLEYAWGRQIHGAILSFLNLKKDRFYQIENTPDGKYFVTARGWEDLSELLKSYERNQIPVTAETMMQFLQKEETAREFAAFYQLYTKYGTDYGVREILDGSMSENRRKDKIRMAGQGSFEERFAVTGQILSCLNRGFAEFAVEEEQLESLYQTLKYYKDYQPGKRLQESLEMLIAEKRNALEAKRKTGILTKGELQTETALAETLEEYLLELKKEHITDRKEGFERIRDRFRERTERRKKQISSLKSSLDRAFLFLEDAFGDGQELILFVTELSRNERAMEYISTNGCDKYFQYSEKLLFKKREEELRRSCEKLLSQQADLNCKKE